MPALPACANCGATLHGRFCHACGQKDLPAHLTVSELAHEAVHEFAHVDGKLLLTLRRFLGKPGGLTLDVLQGRRARYASPLRLYLTCSLLFFALAALAPGRTGIITYKESERDAALDQVSRARAERVGRQLVEAISRSIKVNMPRAMFALMPFFAVLTWAFYRNAERYYIPHLYYSLHFHALVFLFFTVALVVSFAGRVGYEVGGLLPLAIFPYHYMGLRRLFGGSRWTTAVKGTAIAILYVVAIAAVLSGILLIEVKRVSGSVS